jgi:glycosyltransferase involved in cell wall biosynthesis
MRTAAATPLQAVLPVTVVISVFNRAELLERALRSVAAQRPRPPAEVIVVDDGSTDGSAEIAERFGARVIRQPRNLGTAKAKQTGVEAASHEWIALLDSDDEWLPEHLEILWRLRRGHVLVASSCIECRWDSPERSFHGALSETPKSLRSPASLLYPENPVPDSAVMFHRETALAAGGFRELLCEDLDIWCRILSRGPGRVSPEVGARYYTHPGQLSNDWHAMHAAHIDIARSFADQEWWSSGTVERRFGVTAWDQFRADRRAGTRGAMRKLLGSLLRSPHRILGALGVIRHRVAVRRRASRLALSGRPSVAILPGCDPSAISEEDRYEVDLSGTGTARALRRLLLRPSAAALVNSRLQALLVRLAGVRPVRLAGVRPVRGSELGSSDGRRRRD